MKQIIYMICENKMAFATFVGFANYLSFGGSKTPIEIVDKQSKWYIEHSNNGTKSVKLKTKMTFDEFILFILHIMGVPVFQGTFFFNFVKIPRVDFS